MIVSFAVVAMAGLAFRTWKHSVVLFVCEVGRYFNPAAGVYSARKQYQPGAVGDIAFDIASPLPSTTLSCPASAPPVAQFAADPVGPQRKKSTVPSGTPFVPERCAVSVTLPAPMTIDG